MVNSLVERATNDMLIGPDWAKNAEICDILNHDIGQAKEVVKGIRKRLRRRNPKVQLLTLTLLETIMMNCGDIIHMHVAHKDIPRKMVKMAKKKIDYRVREKILILIDTWQEAFGGTRARYPQYYIAYEDLLHLGTIFPKRSDNSTPVFTPQQNHPFGSYLHDPHNLNNHKGEVEPTEDSEVPTLSMTEIQNARGIMDVLSEMLNALDPEKKEGIKEEVIVDLVQQCSSYKQRVVHLINSTSNESLINEGLKLNDDLQRLLVKHEAIAAGNSAKIEESKAVPALIDVSDLGDKSAAQPDGRDPNTSAMSETPVDLLLPTPSSDTSAATSKKVDSQMDLLSSDDFFSSEPDQSLAIVPVGEPQPSSPKSQQDYLALSGNMYQNGVAENASNTQTGDGFQSSNRGVPQNEQQLAIYGVQENGALPRPPWESQSDSDSPHSAGQYDPQQLQFAQVHYDGAHPQQVGSNQGTGVYIHSNQVAMYHHNLQPADQRNLQLVAMVPYPSQGNHTASMYAHPVQHDGMFSLPPHSNQFHGYDPQTQFLEQGMYGLSMRDAGATAKPSYYPSTSHVPSGRPSKPEDKLFGDLVNIARSRPNKPSPGTATTST